MVEIQPVFVCLIKSNLAFVLSIGDFNWSMSAILNWKGTVYDDSVVPGYIAFSASGIIETVIAG